MKKYFVFALCLCISALSLTGCKLVNWVNGVDIAKETTVYEESESVERFVYDEDENFADDDNGENEAGEDDSQEGEGGDDKDAGEKHEEKRYE